MCSCSLMTCLQWEDWLICTEYHWLPAAIMTLSAKLYCLTEVIKPGKEWVLKYNLQYAMSTYSGTLWKKADLQNSSNLANQN